MGRVFDNFNRLSVLLYRRYSMSRSSKPFEPKRVVVLAKMTRYELEKSLSGRESEEEFMQDVATKGSDYGFLKRCHEQHNEQLKKAEEFLESKNVEYKVVQKTGYTQELIDWADAVIVAGGDGTFLLGASRIPDNSKPVIGINTDPLRSEGHLSLSRNLPTDEALGRLFSGNFRWLWRSRIRMTLSGSFERVQPILLNDVSPVCNATPTPTMVPSSVGVLPHLQYTSVASAPPAEASHSADAKTGSSEARGVEAHSATLQLPVLSLNEVFIGESIAARMCYYEVSHDGAPFHKQKSSGLIVCTGTGSSSWFYSASHIAESAVRQAFTLANERFNAHLPANDSRKIERLVREYNKQLRFAPDSLELAYLIREPLDNTIYHVQHPRGFSSKVVVKSRMFDGCLAVDGDFMYPFRDGAVVTLETNEQDSLKTAILT